ncbi:MAG: hypothetical protein ABJZ55_26170 [Fuerstiella sp.]
MANTNEAPLSVEEASEALAEHLASIVSTDEVNQYQDDRTAVDAILSKLCGSPVKVSYECTPAHSGS